MSTTTKVDTAAAARRRSDGGRPATPPSPTTTTTTTTAMDHPFLEFFTVSRCTQVLSFWAHVVRSKSLWSACAAGGSKIFCQGSNQFLIGTKKFSVSRGAGAGFPPFFLFPFIFQARGLRTAWPVCDRRRRRRRRRRATAPPRLSCCRHRWRPPSLPSRHRCRCSDLCTNAMRHILGSGNGWPWCHCLQHAWQLPHGGHIARDSADWRH